MVLVFDGAGEAGDSRPVAPERVSALLALALAVRAPVCGELLILAECTVEVQTCESFAHG